MNIRRRTLAVTVQLFLSAAYVLTQPRSLHAHDETDGPDATMMAPVTAIAGYMAHPRGAVRPDVFVKDGLVIVEDFAPYVFSGKDAAARWDDGFRRHAVPLSELTFGFGRPHAFERTRDRVYFVLPTTWRGVYKDRRFEEHGAWSFVLKESAGQWRILAYGWGATDLTDQPAKTR